MSADASWLAPGVEAVILQPWERAALRATSVTVDRVLKRDVVLSNGDRFRIDRMDKRVGGTWGHYVYLVPPSDPRVAETRRRIRHQRLRSAAINTFEDWRRGNRLSGDVAQAFRALADEADA